MRTGIRQKATGNSKRLKLFDLVLCVLLLALFHPAGAQEPKKVPRIGYLSSSNPATESSRADTIRQALRELGFIKGQNIVIEYRPSMAQKVDAPMSHSQIALGANREHDTGPTVLIFLESFVELFLVGLGVGHGVSDRFCIPDTMDGD